MPLAKHQLQALLKNVQKPSQYLGNEVNAIHKDFNACQVRVVLIFPDAYEMGMSHMGTKILYDILNNIEGVVAERCFAPLPDMEAALRENNLPLFSLESKTPLNEFDIIGISLPYELTYTNILNILDLAQLPLYQKDRIEHHPLILGGGTQSYNPEPIADFFDAIGIGDGEELIVEVVNAVWEKKKTNQTKQQLLESLSDIEGIYVPSFFAPIYNQDGTIQKINNLKSDYPAVKKRIVQDLNAQPYPTKLVVPNIRLIHDRIGIEIQRGCTRMCRFCQAGYIERPTRQRSPEKVLEIAEKSLQQTGIEEISLLSLSAGDYQTIVPTLKELNKRYKDNKVSISVPATRTETLTPEMIEQIKKVRMTGFTIAPEAGSERMRRVINKGNKVEDLLQACRNAFSAGYKLIKFYYMCGLPFETDNDVKNIAHESYQSFQIGLEYNKGIRINVSVSSFVPKPFTPFQWEPQMTIAETKRKHHLVKSNLKNRNLNFKCHEPEMSYLEGLFSRGDRHLSRVIETAFKNGCRFDEWTEHFDFTKWQKAFEQTKVDLDFYIHRRRQKDEIFPWDHLFSQMKKEWLWKEFKDAEREAYVADCSIDKCAAFCGVCDFKDIKNKIYVIDEKSLAAKKGNREWYGRFSTLRPCDSATGREEINQKSKNVTISQSRPVAKSQSQKLRVLFAKKDYAALMSHLELMAVLKRAINRNKFPVAYSEGYHPQMKLAMGYALSLGVESDCEYFDLVLTQDVQVDEFIEKMNIALPQGIRILKADYIDLNTPSLYSETKSFSYLIQFPDSVSESDLKNFKNNLTDFQNGKEFQVTRVNKKNYKKPKIILINQYLDDRTLSLNDKKLELTIKCDDQGSLKPTEIISALSHIKNKELAQLRVRKVGVTF